MPFPFPKAIKLKNKIKCGVSYISTLEKHVWCIIHVHIWVGRRNKIQLHYSRRTHKPSLKIEFNVIHCKYNLMTCIPSSSKPIGFVYLHSALILILGYTITKDNTN